MQVGFRPTNATLVSVYGALVGQPALGAPPAQLRSSGVDFAEAPFTYEMTETTHDSTKVATIGFSTRLFTIEASSFHDAVTTGDHTELDTDGDIDSRSARITLTPTPNFAFQVSRGELGEEPTTTPTPSAVTPASAPGPSTPDPPLADPDTGCVPKSCAELGAACTTESDDGCGGTLRCK